MPKVFISYSWTSEGHREKVRSWADRLLSDGVDVVIDIYDLKEGHDKFFFMEKMVTDPTVTHVLVVSDERYSLKANEKRDGVGTESQIISKEIYGKVDQSKFIPLVTAFDEKADPALPVFLHSRVWIDFSSQEAVNQNWEQLIRTLHGKPARIKPRLGSVPLYLSSDSGISGAPISLKLEALTRALHSNSKYQNQYRRDFIEAVLAAADAIRMRENPALPSTELGKSVISDCLKLKELRNHVVDWILLEGGASAGEDFVSALLDFLEKTLELKTRPIGMTHWQEEWFTAEALFVYETFLYIVASLLKSDSFQVLHEVLTSSYLKPAADRYGDNHFTSLASFNTTADILQPVLAHQGRAFLSPAAELFKRQADRVDVTFSAIIQADLLILLMSLLPPVKRWHPQTLYYATINDFPFFVRATQHRNFLKLATITGEPDASALRERLKLGFEQSNLGKWSDIAYHIGSPLDHMNLSKLDTL